MKQKRERAEPSLASRCRRCFACFKRWFHITGEKSGCLGHPTNARVTNGPSSNPLKGTWLHSFLWTPGTNCHPAYLLRIWERRARVYTSRSPLLGRQPTLPYWLPPQVPQSSLDWGAMFGQDRKRKRSPCYLELFTAGLSGGRTWRWGRKTPTTTCKCFPWKGVAMGLTEAPHQRCRASCLSFQMDPARPPPNLPTSSLSLRGDCWSLHLLSLVWLQAWSPTPQASLPWGLILLTVSLPSGDLEGPLCS